MPEVDVISLSLLSSSFILQTKIYKCLLDILFEYPIQCKLISYFIKFTGMTLINKIIHVSSVQLYDTLSYFRASSTSLSTPNRFSDPWASLLPGNPHFFY